MSHVAPIFAGRSALVTGASSGIGHAVALRLARAGADVALNYWTMPEAAEQAADEIRALGRKCHLERVDIADQTAVEAMFDRTQAALGPVSLFVSSAVYSDREMFTTADMAGFHKTIDVSLMGAFYAMRAYANRVIAAKLEGAAVVVSSPHAHVPVPSCMAYNIAKAGLDQLARTAAIELLTHKVRVNIFYPGWTDTPGERKFFSDAMMAKTAAGLPMGRLGTPDEMARGICFLLDPESGYMTGTTLAMEGGLNLPVWSKRGQKDEF